MIGTTAAILGGAALLGGVASGAMGASAAKSAASTQAASSDAAIAEQHAAREEVRGDLAPYRDAGTAALPGLTSLVTDPNAQKDFITKNPFYQSLATDATNKLFANQAAKGKLGSGGTAEALQNSLLLLGNDLLNQNIGQRQNLVSTGASAAAQTGTAVTNSANTISDLITQKGNATAAGTIGAANAGAGAFNNLVNTGVAAYGISKGIKI